MGHLNHVLMVIVQRYTWSVSVVSVIPSYRAKASIRQVAMNALEYCDKVIVVDDDCPDQTGKEVLDIHDSITVIFRNSNGGVGAATKTGIEQALLMNAAIIVKLDADGQMDASLIPELVKPLKAGFADFCKGTRFDSPEDLEGMPKVRLVGNAVLSLINKFTSGYWSINDPTNGFIAFNEQFARAIDWRKIKDGYFFESDLLFRARLISARVVQLRMRSSYQGEKSSLNPFLQIMPFALGHIKNQWKRLLYMYFVREWNLGTVYFAAGILSLTVAVIASFSAVSQAGVGAVGTGTAVLASMGYILWVQLTTAFLTVDIGSEPK